MAYLGGICQRRQIFDTCAPIIFDRAERDPSKVSTKETDEGKEREEEKNEEREEAETAVELSINSNTTTYTQSKLN